MPEGREDSRDILIELRADVRQIRQSVEHFRQSDMKQWERLDQLSRAAEGHEKSISFLTKGFWIGFTSIVTGAVGVVVWIVNHRA